MKKRLEKLIEKLNKNNVNQIIISNPKTIEYFTGIYFEPGERMNVLLINNDNNIMMFINNLFNIYQNDDIKTILFDDTDNCVQILSRYMNNKGIVGIDCNWPARFLLPLQKYLFNCEFVDGSNIINDVKKCKDEDEQLAMIQSSKINDLVMEETIKLIKEGVCEIDIANDVKKLFIKHGCSNISFEPIISFGKNAANPHHEPDNTICKKGDCVVIDIGGIFNNYCSDMTRTVFLNEISDKNKEIYDIVLQANLNAIKMVKPGNKMSDVDKAARDYIESKGYGKYFTHRTGHSIGLEVHEPGDVSKINDAIIEVGQTFSIEPGIYIPNDNIGVRIEDLVLVKENGCQVLNSVSKEIKIIK